MSEDRREAKKIERGWCHGSAQFRQELLAQMESNFGPHHGGTEKQESAQGKAERILVEAGATSLADAGLRAG
jgi:hypothetical protein